MLSSSYEARLRERIADHSAIAGVVGLGYVGLPLAVVFGESEYRTIGFDVDTTVTEDLGRGVSHIGDVASADVLALVTDGYFEPTADPGKLADCDVISICVPTPLNKIKDPDLSYVVAAARAVRDVLRPGQLVILESTTYPGTTREVVLPILLETGLQAGVDFFLCFSPERVDPGNLTWHTRNTPKVIGGITETCSRLGQIYYGKVFDTVVPVSSSEAAELVKVYENTFRMINIALANELAQACDRLGLDVWEVIDAAATKPFGFMKFTPGPGLGGHCIPLDPHYLSWKMRTLSFKARLIEIASEINAEMPAFVVRKISDALNDVCRSVRDARVLVLGVAYKRDIGDLRESPAIEVIRLLQEQGAVVQYHDPYCSVIKDDGHTPLRGLPLHSVVFDDAVIVDSDVVVIITDHTSVDYDRVARHAHIVVDTRGVMRTRSTGAQVVGLGGQAHCGHLAERAFIG